MLKLYVKLVFYGKGLRKRGPPQHMLSYILYIYIYKYIDYVCVHPAAPFII